MKKLFYYFLLSNLILLLGCKVNKSFESNSGKKMEKIILDDVVIKPGNRNKPVLYQPMAKKEMDLLHTCLEVSFDYENQWVIGRANLLLKPYFLPVQSFKLDAKGFQINSVQGVFKKDTLSLEYAYDTSRLEIFLGGSYNGKDTFKILIDYIAKPSELRSNGGSAITDNKGLYFINPKGTDPNKPRQIWTQGETENSSAWFPTIDVPGEKHTQEIYITLKENETSLSNGLLMSSKKIGNGFKIDHWSQKLPHAPYLAMLAVGNFTVTKDKWRDKEVNYYLEPTYQKHAKMIFGKTPKMMDVYSKLTGVDYPWEKFSQVVARDFVSGAMENTGAVLHYEGVQHDEKQHLDNNHEDIIAHELFHQWFGDYVTARSWSQLPLNESFATYGEYLWNESEYGKDFADYQFERARNSYFRSKNKHKTPAIRNYYNDPDELFDVVSYQKGGRILHMLRNELGDDVFFRGINIYLTKNAFGAADIHDLRKAFELASGLDLNLFFNQWFIGSGHPVLKVNYSYTDSLKLLKVRVFQLVDSETNLFTFPVKIGIGNEKGKVKSEKIIISKKYEEFEIPFGENPQYLTFDEDGVLLAQIEEVKTNQQWLNQFCNSNNYGTYFRSFEVIKKWKKPELMSLYYKATQNAVNNKYFYKQQNGFELISNQPALVDSFKNQILDVGKGHEVSKNRAQALNCYGLLGKESIPTIIQTLNDPSYLVVSNSLSLLAEISLDTAVYFGEQMLDFNSGEVQESISEVFAKKGNLQLRDYMKMHLGKYGMYRFAILKNIGDYLAKSILSEGEMGLEILRNYAESSSDRDLPKRLQKISGKLRKQAETDMKSTTGDVKIVYEQFLNKLNDFDAYLISRTEG